MTDNIKNLDESAASEIKRLRDAGRLSQTVSDDIERETRRYPRVFNGGRNE